MSDDGISISVGGTNGWSAVLLCVLLIVVGGNCAACNWENHRQQLELDRTARQLHTECIRAGGQLIEGNCVR